MSALAPFRVRSFRFRWPADLAMSWAFEMEALIPGWYVLATTGSVQFLVAVAALAWLGSLFSPFFGIVGDLPVRPCTDCGRRSRLLTRRCQQPACILPGVRIPHAHTRRRQ